MSFCVIKRTQELSIGGTIFKWVSYLKNVKLSNRSDADYDMISSMENADRFNHDAAEIAARVCNEREQEISATFTVVDSHEIRGFLAGKEFGF